MPHRTRGEGLFMAILRKPGEPGETRREALLSTAEKTEKRNKKNKTPRIAIPDEWRLLVANPDRYTFISDEEKIIAIPAEYTTDYKLLDRHLDLLHTGITVATLKGKDYVPSYLAGTLHSLRYEPSRPLRGLPRHSPRLPPTRKPLPAHRLTPGIYTCLL